MSTPQSDLATVAAVATGAESRPNARPRTWPALLALLFLAPILGEVFSWSTPPLAFLLPTTMFFETALYGCGAILIRETARRRGLGWGNILLMGAAYGVFEEGLYVQTWFNPGYQGLHALAHYGRFFDTAWVWALGLTVFHMVFSITIPILLAESFFPRAADRPWLGRKGLAATIAWFSLTGAFAAIMNGFVLYAKSGYTHPPAAYLVAIAMTVCLFLLGSSLRFAAPQSAGPRSAPGVWPLRIGAFLVTTAFFFAFYGLSTLSPYPIVPIAAMLALVGYAVAQCLVWSRRADWGARQRLALASGAFGFWIVVSPIAIATFLPVVALIFLGLLVWLAAKIRGARIISPPTALASDPSSSAGAA